LLEAAGAESEPGHGSGSTIEKLTKKMNDRTKRLKSAVLMERNERNALQVELQERDSIIEQREDMDVLADRIKKLKARNRSLKMKIESREQQHQRETALLEQQWKEQVLNAQHEAQNNFEEGKKLVAAQTQKFLLSVCKAFNSFVDVNAPITFDTVHAMLRKVRKELHGLRTFRKARLIVDEIKQLLRKDRDKEVVQCVAELIKATDMRGDGKQIRQRLSELAGWIERMFALCGGKFIRAPDIDSMRGTIEPALQGKGKKEGHRTARNQMDDRPSRVTVDFRSGSYFFDE
jgi:hypothetical protein